MTTAAVRMPLPRARAGSRARLVAIVGVLAALVVAFMQQPSGAASGGLNPSANLDQCQNGALGNPITLWPCVNGTLGGTSYSNWVNGNVNGSKAHWREGEFLTYRAKLSGLAAGSHTLVFQYDTVHSGKHAIDYLGSFDATETTSPTTGKFHRNANNPCADILGTNGCTVVGTAPTPAATGTIPVNPGNFVNCAGSTGQFTATQQAGSMSLFAPSTAGASAVLVTPTAAMVPSGTGQCSATITVTFNLATRPPSGGWTVVLAWGGHIASQLDWGVGSSATAISGSPYHMALDTLDGATLGSQDRALSTSAIFYTPSIATVLAPASVAVGGSIHDTATLANASDDAGGTVTYTVFSDSSCTTQSATGGKKTVTNGVVPDSDPVTFGSAGQFYWQAAYSGDSRNVATTSSCNSEIATVGQATTSVTTTLSATTASIGQLVHDGANVNGGTSNAGGTATYTVYSDDKCSANALPAGTKPVTNGVAASSNDVSFARTGKYYWLVVYSGDGNNKGATSACGSEVVTVVPNAPTIKTVLSTSSAAINAPVNDTATLTGASADATGTVTYTVYSDSICKTKSADAGSVTVAAGKVPDSTPVRFNAAGTYYWQAYYGGDTNNNDALSPCTEEKLVVNPNSPTLGTSLSATSATIGTPVHDSSSLTGATADAGGTVSYSVFTDLSCTTLYSLAGTKPVTKGMPGDSDPVTLNKAGTFYWQAVYSGDANNNGTTSTCDKETVSVSRNKPSITTNLSETSGKITDSVHDSATLTGATSDAGGTVTYTVYRDSGCTTKLSGAGTKAVTNAQVLNSDDVKFNAAGTYYWQADYSGDDNNEPAHSACINEQLVIAPNAPTIGTLLSGTDVKFGSTVNDTSTLSGATADAGGTVTYTVYSDTECSKNAQDAGTVDVTKGIVPDSKPITFANAGTYYWEAVYSGDGNNLSATSPCTSEKLVVELEDPIIVTTQNLIPNDAATISGVVPGSGGTLTFRLFGPSDSDCSGTPAYESAPIPAPQDGVYETKNTSFVASEEGTWRWEVEYSGDSNNEGTLFPCGHEWFVISNSPPAP